VQLLALAGMVAYLAGRPASELRTLAEAYIKNSDIFAAREAKKRKASAGATTGAAAATDKPDKPDKVLVDTFVCLCVPLLSRPLIPFLAPPTATVVPWRPTAGAHDDGADDGVHDPSAAVRPSGVRAAVAHVVRPPRDRAQPQRHRYVHLCPQTHTRSPLFSRLHLMFPLRCFSCCVCGLCVVVTKTVQMFKRTHQDRWETDYKHRFSREQLEDLQGAGAAHYFS
jgi:hypothetical protein